MNHRDQTDRQYPVPQADSPGTTLLFAAIFLFCGWYFRSLSAVSSAPAIYQLSVSLFSPMSYTVGGGLVLVGILTMLNVRWAIVLDCLFTAIAAIGCLFIGGVWVTNSDQEGFLLLLFGLINGGTAISSFRMSRRMLFGVAAMPRESSVIPVAGFDDAPPPMARPAPPRAQPAPPPTSARNLAPPAPPAAPVQCPDCGHENAPSTLFCNACGKKLFSGAGNLKADR